MSLGVSGLGHQRQRVAFGIFKVGQPHFSIRQRGDLVGFGPKRDAARCECVVHLLDVFYGKVEDGPRVVEARLWSRQHQSHAIAVEKRKARRRREQKRQTERVAIEAHGPVDIVCAHRDLVDPREPASGHTPPCGSS